jgi:hypothetical protein
MFKTLLAATAGFFILVSPASSQTRDFTQSLNDARENFDQGKFGDVQRALRDAMMAVSNRAPLSFDFFDVVTKNVPNYANYTLRADNVFKAGEPILLYAEPIGYAFMRKGEAFRFSLEADFELLDSNGKILGGQKKFQRWVFESKAPTFDFYMNLTYSFNGLAPGKYAVRTVLHDLVDEDEAWFEFPFEIR